MRSPSSLVLRILRAGLLSVLMLGVLLKPVLGLVCEQHGALHLLSAARDDEAASPRTHAIDLAHDGGAHARWHEGDVSSVYADLVGVVVVPPPRFGAAVLPVPHSPDLPTRPAGVPFRPPIA